NPVQSRVFEYYDKDCNVIIAANTSSGKTVCAEMFVWDELKRRGGTALYLAPMKALAKEKIDDWTDESHGFSKMKLSICTGDFRLTAARKKELEESNIILMTSEMINSRCRNYESEHNEFLAKIGTAIVDESHVLTVPSRGDHLEVGLMKLAQIAPNIRIVFLSATMPNAEEIANWVSYSLTKKDTVLLESEFRPCPLGIHFETYEPMGSYEATEEEKVASAMDIILDNKEDKFLVFAHTKRTGYMMQKALQVEGIAAEFHNADLDKNKRQDLETRFREGDLPVVVATSTLAWGLNLPARRVIILGVTRGLTEVDTYDIWQMAGRAGRPGFDPRGDVYILMPDHKSRYFINKLQEHQPIVSRLLDYTGAPHDPHYKTLAFHLISEIHHGYIKRKSEIKSWYEKSLAHFQAQDLDDKIVDATLDLLIKCGAVKEEDGILKATIVGTIASMFYYSPFDVADLRRNFKYLFDGNLQSNDVVVSMCLGNVDSLKMSIVNKDERAEMLSYKKKVVQMLGENEFTDGAIKSGFAYYSLLNGEIGPFISSVARMQQWDFPRLAQVLVVIDKMSGKWGQSGFLNELQLRIAYGVRRELLPLCSVPDIGKIRAEKLYSAGIRSPKDMMAQKEKLGSVLGFSSERVSKLIDGIKLA
ncbi:MAG: DEAD/DEAH box helicase, partial [Chloroflexi bacterium]|nr:DEAD/DEAH box helicase [Chloroflexota bacterium]